MLLYIGCPKKYAFFCKLCLALKAFIYYTTDFFLVSESLKFNLTLKKWKKLCQDLVTYKRANQNCRILAPLKKGKTGATFILGAFCCLHAVLRVLKILAMHQQKWYQDLFLKTLCGWRLDVPEKSLHTYLKMTMGQLGHTCTMNQKNYREMILNF